MAFENAAFTIGYWTGQDEARRAMAFRSAGITYKPDTPADWVHSEAYITGWLVGWKSVNAKEKQL